MTNERNDMNDRDADIRRSYRRLSDETTPAGLDERILAQAARAARPGYVRPVRWMRPLAWAATIVLTVSIILQVGELPDPADVTPQLAEPNPVVDERDADRLDQAMESGPSSTPAAGPADDSDIPEEAPVAQAPAATATERRERTMATGATADAEAAKATDPSESFGTAADALPDTDMLRRASELARQQESGSEAAPIAAERTLRSMAAEPAPGPCTDADRRSGGAWFACIERLRDEGRQEAAAAELAELTRVFPDFEVP